MWLTGDDNLGVKKEEMIYRLMLIIDRIEARKPICIRFQ